MSITELSIKRPLLITVIFVTLILFGWISYKSLDYNLLPKFETWVDEFAWAPNSKEIYFVSPNAGEEPIYETDVDGPMAGKVSGIAQHAEVLRLALLGEEPRDVPVVVVVGRGVGTGRCDDHGSARGLVVGVHDELDLAPAKIEDAPHQLFSFFA